MEFRITFSRPSWNPYELFADNSLRNTGIENGNECFILFGNVSNLYQRIIQRVPTNDIRGCVRSYVLCFTKITEKYNHVSRCRTFVDNQIRPDFVHTVDKIPLTYRYFSDRERTIRQSSTNVRGGLSTLQRTMPNAPSHVRSRKIVVPRGRGSRVT